MVKISIVPEKRNSLFTYQDCDNVLVQFLLDKKRLEAKLLETIIKLSRKGLLRVKVVTDAI